MYSCDCFGTLIQWDLRAKTAQTKTWELGPHSINSLAIDPAGIVPYSLYIAGTLL